MDRLLREERLILARMVAGADTTGGHHRIVQDCSEVAGVPCQSCLHYMYSALSRFYQVKQIAKTGCNVLLIQKSILRDATTELCAAGIPLGVHAQSMF